MRASGSGLRGPPGMKNFRPEWAPSARRRARGVQRAAAGQKISGKERRIRRAGTRRTFQDAGEVLRWSRTWRPGCKARRHGVPACRQGHGRRIKEVAVAFSERGAPAAQWGCHGVDGPYRVLFGTPDRLVGHRHARPLPQAWGAGAVTRPVCPIPCAEMISSATGGDFGLGGTAACGDGGGACALVAASGGDGARIMRIGTMNAEERRCGKLFSGKIKTR